jgi:hypothetical protein
MKMSAINLSLLRLCVGYQISDQELQKHLFTSVANIEDGSFHFETRYNPETGQPFQLKLWDTLPKTNYTSFLDLDGQRYPTDPFSFSKMISERLLCSVERYGDVNTNQYGYSFYVNTVLPYRKITDDFALSSPTIYMEELKALDNSLFKLSFNLRRLGLIVDEPRVFVNQLYV